MESNSLDHLSPSSLFNESVSILKVSHFIAIFNSESFPSPPSRRKGCKHELWGRRGSDTPLLKEERELYIPGQGRGEEGLLRPLLLSRL